MPFHIPKAAEGDFDQDFSVKCEGYAITCYVQLKNQYYKSIATTPTSDTICDGSGDDKLSSSTQENHEEENSREDSEDIERKLPQQECTSLLGRFGAYLCVLKEASRLVKAVRFPEKEEGEEEEDVEAQTGLGQDEPNQNQISTSNSRSDAHMDSNSMDAPVNSCVGVRKVHHSEIAHEEEVKAQKPMFGKKLIPLTDEHSSAVYPWSVEFEGLLLEELNSRFVTLKSLLDTELHLSDNV